MNGDIVMEQVSSHVFNEHEVNSLVRVSSVSLLIYGGNRRVDLNNLMGELELT